MKYYFYIKRLMDVLISIVFLIVMAPVILVTALLIWLQDGHSPFYSHVRVGKDKKPFMFYKFRSMVVNADDILFSDPKLYKMMRTGKNKIEDDPRITRIGKFIRKYSIDEFPQIINVLKGDMSFVGPRALRSDEYEGYEKKSAKNEDRLNKLVKVKPGITGYWQVNGRSKIGFDMRMDMECYYVDHLSFWLDLLIILKTPLAVMKAEGAS